MWPEVYAEYIRETVREQWQTRQDIESWRALVRLTSQDRYTLAIIDRMLRLNKWSRRDAEFAERMAAMLNRC